MTSLLRQLEEALSPEAKAIATEALGELAVLNALQFNACKLLRCYAVNADLLPAETTPRSWTAKAQPPLD